MCDPISLAVVAVCCCCCCVVMVVVMASVLPALGLIAGVASEVLTCINETIGDELSEAMAVGSCRDAEKMGCFEDEEFKHEEAELGNGAPATFRRLNATKPEECKELNAKCVCDVAGSLADIEDPTLDKRLQPCCQKILEYEDNAIVGGMAKPAALMCSELVVNFTKFVDDLDQNCSNGQLPNFENPHSILDGGAGAQTLDVAQKFSVLEDAWQPGRHLAAKAQTAVAGGAGLALLVAAASVLRRRMRTKTQRSAGTFNEDDVEVE